MLAILGLILLRGAMDGESVRGTLSALTWWKKMKAFKELIRILSKVVGGIVALVFLRASFTDTGWMLMAISVVVGLVCMAGYMWSEPDVHPTSSEDSN